MNRSNFSLIKNIVLLNALYLFPAFSMEEPNSAMPKTFSRETEIAPYTFTFEELLALGNGESLFKEQENHLRLELKAPDPHEISSVLPSSWRMISTTTISSRISKIQEGWKEKSQDVLYATYKLEQDYLGYGPYEFKVNVHLKFLKESKEEKVNEGVYYTLQAVGNILQAPQGTCLTPSILKRDLLNSLSEKPSWIPSLEMHEYWEDATPLYYCHQKESCLEIISLPAHDLPLNSSPQQQMACGNLSLFTLMENLQHLSSQEGTIKIYIPIAQGNGWRRHWTLLVLEKAPAGKWMAHHIDSKGPSSAFYKLDNIQQALKIISCEEFQSFYLGHQGLFNNSDCGRFVMGYIKIFTQEGKDPKNFPTSEVTSFFDVQ